MSGTAPQWWWLVLGLGALLVLAQWLTVLGVAAWTLVAPASTLAAAALVLGIVLHRPRPLSAWRWIALFMIATAVADHLLAAYTWLWHHVPPVVGPPDVFYLGGLGALFVALLMISRGGGRVRGDLDSALDMATVAVVGSFLAWELIVSPTIADTSLSIIDRVGLVAYPVLDVMLLTLLFRLLMSRDRGPSAMLLTVGLTCWVVADTSFLLFSQTGLTAAWGVALPNSAWVAGEVWFALAALHPRMRELAVGQPAGGTRPLSAGRLAFAIAAFVVPALTDAAYQLAGRDLNAFAVFAASALLGTIVVTRSILLLRGRDQAEAKLVRREAYYHLLARTSADATVVMDADGRIAGVVGSDPHEQPAVPVGASFFQGIQREDHEDVRAALEKARLVPDKPFTVEARAYAPDGTMAWIEARVMNLTAHPEVGAFVVNVHDVTRRKVAEDEVRHRAFHDGLTELPNRTLFRDRLEQSLRRTTRSGASIAVVFIDLDGFKNVNDSLGHDAGDELLRVVAQRFTDCVRASDTVARLGGDEFAVLVDEQLHIDEQAEAVAERILQTLADPIDVAGTRVTIRASIGIAIGSIGADAGSLLRDADIAMYQAKTSGKGRYVRYEAAMQLAVSERLQLESELFGALDRGEMHVAYQPVIELESGALTGFEALVRWRHPELGEIRPDRFIPIAEENGLVVHIGRFVLDTACRVAADWHERYPAPTPLTMAVNVSGRDLERETFVAEVAEVIERTGIDPATLVLEITETVLIADADIVATRLAGLRALGLRIAVDDFGTGYSSLSYLRQFPVDILKVDRSFVNTIKDKEQLPAILRGLFDLGAALELETIAEGVERDFQRDQLRDVHCRLAQGFLFATPLDTDAAEGYIEAHSTVSVAAGDARLLTPVGSPD